MKNLIHIVYVSFAQKALSEEELKNLLQEIRGKNAEQGVTGLLLYNDGAFIQVIEGNEAVINRVFNSISKDNRHTNVVKLLEEPIDQRAFPDWSMGFRQISEEQSSSIPGFSDFMHHKNPVQTIRNSTEQVIYLLNSFRKFT